jgi:hypothetical protein
MHLASGLAMQGFGLPRVYWNDDAGTSLTIDGRVITIAGLKDMVATEIAEAEEVFESLLCGVEESTLGLKYDHIIDSLANTSVSYSFLTDSLNPFVHMRHPLIKAFLTDPHLQGTFNAPSLEGSVRWKQAKCRSWLIKCKTLLEHLFVLIHLTYGQPARGEELAITKICNTPWRPRNLYAVNGRIVLIGGYHKSLSNTGQDKIIPRALPDAVGSLLLRYLALIRPVEQVWASKYFDANGAQLYSTHLFVAYGRRWDGADLSGILKRHTSERLKVPLGLSEW